MINLISPVNQLCINENRSIEQIRYDIVPYYEVAEAELDEMRSYVFSKENRVFWQAHENGSDGNYINCEAYGRTEHIVNLCEKETKGEMIL